MDELTERLRRFVRARVSSRQDAEDVIQEAYLRVLRYSADHVVEDRERLLFAGEAVHETLWGTVGGAWESGERAAAAVVRSLTGRG